MPITKIIKSPGLVVRLAAAAPPPPPAGSSMTLPIVIPVTATAWTNMPSALTEIFALTTRRYRVNLDGLTRFALSANQTVAGATGAVLGLQYSLDAGVTFKGMDNGTAGSNSTTTLAVTATGIKASADGTIATEARVDNVIVRVVGQTGNGVADPAWHSMIVYFKA